MARLQRLKPAIASLPPRIAVQSSDEAERSRQRDKAAPWRAWYRTARWRAIRMATFDRDSFTCRMCGRLEGDISQLVCDHVTPHRGDPDRFWNGPFQTLCKTCHDRAKQRDERRLGL